MHTSRTTPQCRLRKLFLSSVYPAMGLAAGLLLSNTAFAQTKIEQMIVTATKRALDVQQVPASISAFSGEGLEKRSIKNVDDLTHTTPNVTFQITGGTTPILSIRGVAADGTAPLMEQTVALHVDGIYQPRAYGLQTIMSDIDSVEILRGPQGTVYGRNANAGVININTAKPTDDFRASGTIFADSLERYGVRGYVSGPVAEGISMRLSGVIDRSRGFVKNEYNGDWINGDNIYASRLSVRLKPVDTVTVDLSASQFFNKDTHPFILASDPAQGPVLCNNSTGPTITSAGAPCANGAAVNGAATPAGATLNNYTLLKNLGYDVRYTLEPWKTYQAYNPDNTTKMVTASGIINWEITPDVSLKSINGWQWATNHSYQDQDGMPAAYLNGRAYGDSHTWSTELNLSAKLFDRVDLVAGLYYMDDLVRGGNLNPIIPGNPVGPLNVVAGAGPFLYLHNIIDQKTTSTAGFLDATISITDDLRLLGGVRRTIDHRDVTQFVGNYRGASPNGEFYQAGAIEIAGGCLNSPGGAGSSGSIPRGTKRPQLNFTSTTFRGGVQYDFTPEITGYLQWQDGFKDGAYNVSLCDNQFKPEQVYSWEGGVKSTLFNGTTTLNVAVFDYRYSNMQLSRTINLSATSIATVIDNAASAKLQGGEIELVSNLTDSLSTDISLGVLSKADYGPLSARNGAVPGNPLVNLSGNRLPRAPKITLSAGLEYTTRIGDFGDLKSRAEYSYRSSQYFTAFDEAIAAIGGYSLWNAYFTFTPDNSPYELQVFCKNISDKYYISGSTTSGIMFMARSVANAPRTFGAQATVKF